MSRASEPRVFIIILNWNGWKDTLECLASLERLDYSNYDAVVVDNGSTDESEARIRGAYPGTTLLQTGRNQGFAGGNNLGIEYALVHGAEYVWLLNNDTTVEPGALSPLVRRCETDPRIGFVGSKILFADRVDRIWYAGGTVSRLTGAAVHVPFDVPDDDRLSPAHETDYASGCSILARRQVIEQIGGLPEMYFLYYEDVDWQFLGRRRGWKVSYEPESVVLHKASASVEVDSPFQLIHSARSRMIFLARHRPGAVAPSFVSLLCYLVMFKLIRRRWSLALYNFKGLLDGVICGLRYCIREHNRANIKGRSGTGIPRKGAER